MRECAQPLGGGRSSPPLKRVTHEAHKVVYIVSSRCEDALSVRTPPNGEAGPSAQHKAWRTHAQARERSERGANGRRANSARLKEAANSYRNFRLLLLCVAKRDKLPTCCRLIVAYCDG